MYESNVIYVGVDVHKDTNSVCMFNPRKNSYFNDARINPGAEYLVRYLRKAEKNLDLGPDVEFRIGYEAGPTGCGLCRDLLKNGYNCVILAPTTIPKASGDRVKTDARDAKMIASALAHDSYKAVFLLDLDDEAARELTRVMRTMKDELKRAKQHLLSFLLARGMSYPYKGAYWTRKFNEWLDTLKFASEWLQFALETYRNEVRCLEEKVALMEAKIDELADSDRYREAVAKLVCFAGIKTLTAVSLVCEVGDFSRFGTAEAFASYLGLCPGQDSSGLRTRFTGITKTGNTRLRLLLVEASHAIRKSNPYGKSKALLARQAGQSPETIAYADKGSRRVKNKILKLERGNKNCNVAVTAGARELACFIWGMMNGKTV